MRASAGAALVAGLLLATAPAAARRRTAQSQFAPVTLDHLFEENLTFVPRPAHDGAGQDDNGAEEVCMGDMCWTNEESAAMSNIVRAYLMPRYGIDPMFERRLLQGVFSSLLAQHWSDKVSADLVPDADDHAAAAHQAAKPKKKRGWLNRRAAGQTEDKDADRRDNEGSGASGRHSKQHYLATWALMLARSHTHIVSRTELLIGAYLAEQWIYDPYPSCLTLAAGGGASVSSVHRDGAALGNYTAVSRSDGHRISYHQRPPPDAKKSSSASSQPSFRVAFDEASGG